MPYSPTDCKIIQCGKKIIDCDLCGYQSIFCNDHIYRLNNIYNEWKNICTTCFTTRVICPKHTCRSCYNFDGKYKCFCESIYILSNFSDIQSNIISRYLINYVPRYRQL